MKRGLKLYLAVSSPCNYLSPNKCLDEEESVAEKKVLAIKPGT
jgi:hypothetical protein